MIIEVKLKSGRTLTERDLMDEPIEAGLLGAIVDEMKFYDTEFNTLTKPNVETRLFQ